MEWQTVYSTTDAYRAEILKQVLENEGLIAVVINKMDSSYHIGEIYVNVESEFYEKAMEIVEDFEKQDNIE
jgi:hypothetical protein